MSIDKTHLSRSMPLAPWPAEVCLINWIQLTEIRPLTHSRENKRIHTFPKRESEHNSMTGVGTDFEDTAQHFNHYTTGTSPNIYQLDDS